MTESMSGSNFPKSESIKLEDNSGSPENHKVLQPSFFVNSTKDFATLE